MHRFFIDGLEIRTLATHLLADSDQFLNPDGAIFRKSSFDELLQLRNIFVVDISFAGPRPALFNQFVLMGLRTENGIDMILPECGAMRILKVGMNYRSIKR